MCGKTKKIILLAIILSALQLLIFSGTSFSGIQGSYHDLSAVSGGGPFSSTNEPQICIFCHTPHQAKVVDLHGNRLPLWNRALDADSLTFQVYDSSPTLNATVGQPQGVSLLCLSCHDGVSAMNVLLNYGDFNPITMTSNYNKIDDIWNSGFLGYPGANIGESAAKDLSNDHPISFVYNSTLVTNDGGLKDPSGIAPLKLFGNNKDMLECATCHDPHEQGIEGLPGSTYPFLRMSNDSSAMCVKCHNK